MRVSEEQYKRMQGVKYCKVSPDRPPVPSKTTVACTRSPYRSKLEAAWANYLHGLWMLKTINYYYYEPLNLRLPGGKNFYKPDFLVVAENGLTFYEIKGRNKSDDRSLVKIKTAAGITPWAKFVLVKRIGGQWEERIIA
jgi:hypothetical protein